MWSRTVVAVLLVLVAVGAGAASAVAGGPGAVAGGPGVAGSTPSTAAGPEIGASQVGPEIGATQVGAAQVGTGPADNATLAGTREIMAIRILPNGSANWTIVTTVPLAGANRTAAFERVETAFEDGDVGGSLAAFRRAADAASTATGREMNITGVTRSATVLTLGDTTTTVADADTTGTQRGVGTDGTLAPASDEPNTNETDAATGVGTGSANETNTTTRVGTESANDTRTVGRFVLSFRWRNFANASGGLLRVGDAFETPSGTWLPGLTEGQTLLIQKPFGYAYRSASKGPEQGALRWSGPIEFVPGQPSVVYVRQGQPSGPFFTDDPLLPSDDTPPTEPPATNATTTQTTPTRTVSPTQPPPTDRSFPFVPAIGRSPWLVAGIVMLVVLVLAAAAWLWRSGDTPASAGSGESRGEPPDGPPPDGAPSDGPPSDESAVGSADDPGTSSEDATTNRTPEPGAGSTPEGEARAGASATGQGTDALLTDEERVEGLLEENDGRMRQAEIVTQTDWSNAKVSQLLSGMAETDRIEKLRLGRENLISLPEDGGPGDGEETPDADGGRR